MLQQAINFDELFGETVSQVTARGIEKFTQLMQDENALWDFLQTNESQRFLKALNNSEKGRELISELFLLHPESVSDFADGPSQSFLLMNIIKSQPLELQCSMLSTPSILLYAGQGEAYTKALQAAIDLIKAQPLTGQRRILATDNAMSGIAKHPDVLGLVQKQPLEGQAEILAKHFAAEGLAFAGYANEVVAMIKLQPLDNRLKILSAEGTIDSLVINGCLSEVGELIREHSLTEQRQMIILTGLTSSLVVVGYETILVPLIKLHGDEEQSSILHDLGVEDFSCLAERAEEFRDVHRRGGIACLAPRHE